MTTMTTLDRLTKRLQFSFDDTNTIYKVINDIDKLNTIFQMSERLSHQTTKRLTQSVLVTSSGSSNRIEWNRMTDEEVEMLYRHMNIKKFKTRDEQEVAWYIELLELVFEGYQSISFNEWVILQFHDMMLKYTEKDAGHRGKYKFWPNRVEARDEKGRLIKVIFNPTEPALTPIEMKALIQWTQDAFHENDIHPLLIIANFIFELLAIHPFQDGNGRISRIVTNLLLLKNGYTFVPYVSHERLIEQKKIEYYIALGKTQQWWKTNHEDMSERMLFFLQIVKTQIQMAIDISQKEDIQPHLSKIQSKVWDFISSTGECTRQEIVKKTWLALSTVRQTIEKLLLMKKIERFWSTRAVRYEIIK